MKIKGPVFLLLKDAYLRYKAITLKYIYRFFPLLFIMCASGICIAQNNYGIYNYSDVQANAPLQKEIERWNDNLLQDLMDSLQVMEGELMSLYHLYLKKHHITAEEANRIETILLSKTTEIENFKINAEARYLRYQHENNSLLKENITTLLHNFMRENSLLFLSELDKVITCKDCKDYTTRCDYLHAEKTVMQSI